MRRVWKIGLAAAATLLVAGAGTYKISKATCFTLTGEAVCRVEMQQKLVALTFDDGPTADGLDSVLPVLKRYRAKGTFFLIGRHVETDPKQVRRLVEAGHEVGNHSQNHRRMLWKSSSFYDREIAEADALLMQAGAPRPALFRPPFGKKLIGLPLAVERSGKQMIMWDSGDPPDRDPKIYAAKVLARIRPGSITLIHPMYSANATERAALPIILQELTRRGYRMVTVSELLAAGRKEATAR